jgi:aminopeptidase N
MTHPTQTLLSAYTPPDFLIDHVTLDVDIRADHARVSSRMEIRRNPKGKKSASLFLNGEELKLVSVAVNGRALSKKDCTLTNHGLTIPNMPPKAVVEIISTHNPHKNTALSGFYASGSMLSTQCESEGFRRIIFYPDRPDVMAKFRVTLHADKKKYPVLLANGNLIATGAESGGRHFATWDDPFRKPCYLFAMVAGKLDKATTHFVTKSGRKVLIEIYTEPGRTKETGFALAALKKSMKWDEDVYGLEYDLDRFMIVATPFFNMGAMENKGLNIFNDACVLGLPETATDSTIAFIERVVAHEYFHNWTGDRVTCRDWFQLSLKEGLTVFREQEFCSDVNSRAVERIDDVRVLRRAQFAEDAGAMAHPVRPDRYQAIDNFYTPTVYEKGAEVVRMIQTMVGRTGFRRGMDLYFKRHDGQAVTCDDFIAAMRDANKLDTRQFMLWYSQAGTPVLKVDSVYDTKKKTLTLRVTQSCPPTLGQKTKKPMHIPLSVGLLDTKGKDMIGTRVLHVKKAREEFVFKNIASKPVLSLLRDFSAPVRLEYNASDEDRLFLLAHDSDAFNRWESAYKLSTKYILALADGKQPSRDTMAAYAAALGNVLRDKKPDADFKAMTLALPSESELGLAMRAGGKLINIEAIYAARKIMVGFIADVLRDDFAQTHESFVKLSPKAADGVSRGKRSLKNLSLTYLAVNGDKKILQQVFRQATTSKNMTDCIAALGILADTRSPMRTKALSAFDKRWRRFPSIMDKWLAVQAGAKRDDVLVHVLKLAKHPAFTFQNPNRISSLIGVFSGNGKGFHAADGSGYRFIADMIIKIDPVNPHSAAALAKAFARWKDYDVKRQKLMKAQLKRIAAHKKLSANVCEIVGQSLR